MTAPIVVVGAGAAGAVIAARATEGDAREVRLLEAGPDYPPDVALPGDLVDGTRNSMLAHDWGYHHLPTRGQRVFPLPRGRVVGGSSAVNTCIALRGHPYDYDEWAARGLTEWSFERCLPAFKRLETDLDFQNQWHGASGPVRIRRHPPSERVRWQRAFLDACAHLGFPACADTNDPTTPLGYGPHAMNKIDGVRQSAARCYLTAEVRGRAGFTLEPDTLVRRVLFEQRKVVGVEVEQAGRVLRVAASQVFLCGGAINTPGILLRSGIGAWADLAAIGVEQVVELPGVARRLLDHPGAAFVVLPKGGVCDTSDPLIQTVMRYTSKDSEYPGDVQLQAGSHLPLSSRSLPFVTLMCSIGKPRGTGVLRFTSADPRARPRIESRLVEHPDDRRRAIEALRLGFELAQTPALSELLRVHVYPPRHWLTSDDRLDRFIALGTGSGYHPSGTVPMGTDRDPDAATDQYGRVRGVEGLFVADASLMPTIPSSNTHLPTLMIGERFGEWLRQGVI